MYVEEIYPRASAANEHLATTEGENCGYSLTLLLGFTEYPYTEDSHLRRIFGKGNFLIYKNDFPLTYL